VSLVLFLDHTRCGITATAIVRDACDSANNWGAYAALHRFAQRFPELEITIVGRTLGFASVMAPPPPAAEADTLRDWLFVKHALPGALAVTATDFWRLPEPDRRRVDREVPNIAHYSFGRTWNVGSGSAFLVDRKGTIVDIGDVGIRSVEGRLTRLIEALFAQQIATR
jgi:hypothetical protein